jgi:hypothetical protein
MLGLFTCLGRALEQAMVIFWQKRDIGDSSKQRNHQRPPDLIYCRLRRIGWGLERLFRLSRESTVVHSPNACRRSHMMCHEPPHDHYASIHTTRFRFLLSQNQSVHVRMFPVLSHGRAEALGNSFKRDNGTILDVLFALVAGFTWEAANHRVWILTSDPVPFDLEDG